jgi:Mlc titration factor MtfA (ptsG expression regulator)
MERRRVPARARCAANGLDTSCSGLIHFHNKRARRITVIPQPSKLELRVRLSSGAFPVGILRNIRRSIAKRENPFTDESWRGLVEEHPILRGMSIEELARLREAAAEFMREKTFEGADGLKLNDWMRAVISLQACLPILNLGSDWYDSWKTVVVVPDIFIEEHREEDSAGIVHEWREDKSGESWDEGPVLFSWKDVESSGWGDGYNVVIHEAAHRLDMTDGKINGRPALHDGMSAVEWRGVFSRAFQDLSRRARSRKKKSRIDGYAAVSDSEFFAVASEYFFEQPKTLKSEYSGVYRLLSAFYRQDPISRLISRGPRRR